MAINTQAINDTLYVENLVVNGTLTIAGGGISMTIKKITMGSWDMNGTSSLATAHGLSATEWLTINNVRVLILDDAQTTLYPMDQVLLSGGGVTSGTQIITSTSLTTQASFEAINGGGANTISGTAGGTVALNNNFPIIPLVTYNSTNITVQSKYYFANNANFNATGFNRGSIIFDYIAD